MRKNKKNEQIYWMLMNSKTLENIPFINGYKQLVNLIDCNNGEFTGYAQRYVKCNDNHIFIGPKEPIRLVIDDYNDKLICNKYHGFKLMNKFSAWINTLNKLHLDKLVSAKSYSAKYEQNLLDTSIEYQKQLKLNKGSK